MGITEHHADLRGGHALLGHLGDLVNNGGGGGLEPRGGGPPIGLGRSGNTLSVRTNRNEASLSVCRSNKIQHTTHSHIPEASPYSMHVSSMKYSQDIAPMKTFPGAPSRCCVHLTRRTRAMQALSGGFSRFYHGRNRATQSAAEATSAQARLLSIFQNCLPPLKFSRRAAAECPHACVVLHHGSIWQAFFAHGQRRSDALRFFCGSRELRDVRDKLSPAAVHTTHLDCRLVFYLRLGSTFLARETRDA